METPISKIRFQQASLRPFFLGVYIVSSHNLVPWYPHNIPMLTWFKPCTSTFTQGDAPYVAESVYLPSSCGS